MCRFHFRLPLQVLINDKQFTKKKMNQRWWWSYKDQQTNDQANRIATRHQDYEDQDENQDKS